MSKRAKKAEGTPATTAFVVHVEPKSRSERSPRDAGERLAEAVGLAAAIGLQVVEARIAPLARATPATLIGSATDDGLPNPPGALTYTWSKATGPGKVTFADPNAASTTATFSIGGVYTLTLTASDGALSGSDTLAVIVNKNPVVNAGPDQVITLPTSATLSGSATDDGLPNPPGALAFTWSRVSGKGEVTFGDANAASTTATFTAGATYKLKLTASDGTASGSDTLIVTVNPTPTPNSN